MASQAQVTANRENAQHSCGPKTVEGKVNIAQNRPPTASSAIPPPYPRRGPGAFQIASHQTSNRTVARNAVEEALVSTIAITQHRSTRIAGWVADLTTQALTADPAADPSRLRKMFSRDRDPAQGLGRLHRSRPAIGVNLHNALKELRLSKETRNRVAAGQNAIAYNDIVNWVEFRREFCERHGDPKAS